MARQIKKAQDRVVNKIERHKEDRPVNTSGNLQVKFNLRFFSHGDLSKKYKMLGLIIVILILVVAAIVFVMFNNPELADKLIRIIETILMLGQFVPSLRNIFNIRIEKVK